VEVEDVEMVEMVEGAECKISTFNNLNKS